MAIRAKPKLAPVRHARSPSTVLAAEGVVAQAAVVSPLKQGKALATVVTVQGLVEKVALVAEFALELRQNEKRLCVGVL